MKFARAGACSLLCGPRAGYKTPVTDLRARLTAPFQAARDDLREFREAYRLAPVPDLRWDLLGARASFRRAFPLLLKEHAAPPRMAAAVWLGVMIGCTPLYGLHYVIVIVLALFLRLNKVVTWIASNISFPLFAPFVALASIQVGSLMTTGTLEDVSLEVLRQTDFAELASRYFYLWLVGGLVFGGALGALFAVPVYVFLRARTETSSPGL